MKGNHAKTGPPFCDDESFPPLPSSREEPCQQSLDLAPLPQGKMCSPQEEIFKQAPPQSLKTFLISVQPPPLKGAAPRPQTDCYKQGPGPPTPWSFPATQPAIDLPKVPRTHDEIEFEMKVSLCDFKHAFGSALAYP